MSVAISALPSGWLQISFLVPVLASNGRQVPQVQKDDYTEFFEQFCLLHQVQELSTRRKTRTTTTTGTRRSHWAAAAALVSATSPPTATTAIHHHYRYHHRHYHHRHHRHLTVACTCTLAVCTEAKLLHRFLPLLPPPTPRREPLGAEVLPPPSLPSGPGSNLAPVLLDTTGAFFATSPPPTDTSSLSSAHHPPPPRLCHWSQFYRAAEVTRLVPRQRSAGETHRVPPTPTTATSSLQNRTSSSSLHPPPHWADRTRHCEKRSAAEAGLTQVQKK